MKFWKLTSVTTALVLSTSVNAAIISTDWKASGDNLITHDTVSGLNWLDLTEANNLSYDAVVAQLGAGEMYDGFRVATSAEVVKLWANFGVNLSAGAPTALYTNDPAVAYAASILGDTWHEEPEARYTGGLGYTSDAHNVIYQSVMGASTSMNVTNYWVDEYRGFNSDVVLVNMATYLVAAVPVPAAVWLFGSGLIGLVGFARRKKA